MTYDEHGVLEGSELTVDLPLMGLIDILNRGNPVSVVLPSYRTLFFSASSFTIIVCFRHRRCEASRGLIVQSDQETN